MKKIIVILLIAFVSPILVKSASALPSYSITVIDVLPDWNHGYNSSDQYVTNGTNIGPGYIEGHSPHGILNNPDGTYENLYSLWGDDLHITDLNDNNHVVGTCDLDHTYDEGDSFIWTEETGMIWIGMLYDWGTEWGWSVADAINNNDQIVGRSSYYDDDGEDWIAGYYWDDKDGIAMLWDLLDDNSGWRLNLNPRDINDAGEIIGTGNFNGVSCNFLMTPNPVPEPSTIILFSMAVPATIYIRRKKQKSLSK